MDSEPIPLNLALIRYVCFHLASAAPLSLASQMVTSLTESPGMIIVTLSASAPKSYFNNPLLTFFFLQATMPSLGDSFATLIFNLCFILIPPLSRIFVAVYTLLTIWRFKGVFDHPVF